MIQSETPREDKIMIMNGKLTSYQESIHSQETSLTVAYALMYLILSTLQFISNNTWQYILHKTIAELQTDK